MIATRSGNDSGGRDFAGQQAGKGATCLERSRVLQKFQFQREWGRMSDAEIAGVYFDDGRATNIRSDGRVGRADVCGSNEGIIHARDS